MSDANTGAPDARERMRRTESGCALTALTVLVASFVGVSSGYVRDDATTRLCAADVDLDVYDQNDGYFHYRVFETLRRGDCVRVYGDDVVRDGPLEDPGAEIRVRLDDGRWGWIKLGHRPTNRTYAPHLAFVRAPVLATLYLVGLIYLAWIVVGFIRTRLDERKAAVSPDE